MVNKAFMEEVTRESYSKQQMHGVFRLKEKEKAAQAREKKGKHEQKWNELCVFGGH